MSFKVKTCACRNGEYGDINFYNELKNNTIKLTRFDSEKYTLDYFRIYQFIPVALIQIDHFVKSHQV